MQQIQSVGSEMKTSSATKPIVLTNLIHHIRSQPLLQTYMCVKQDVIHFGCGVVP